MTYLTRILTSFAMVGALFLFDSGSGLGPGGAWAQTATKLQCKKCVGARQIKKGAIKKNRLKEGAVTLGKLESGLGERANSSQPYYVTMDANNEQRTLTTNGPLRLFARCFINEVGEDIIRLFATSSVAGWFTFDNPTGIVNNGPFAAGQEVQMDQFTTATGTPNVNDEDNGDGIIGPGGFVLSFADDNNVYALNALGHVCTLAGINFVVTGTP